MFGDACGILLFHMVPTGQGGEAFVLANDEAVIRDLMASRSW